MLSVVKYDAGGVEIKLEPETVQNYLVRGKWKGYRPGSSVLHPDLPGAEVESFGVWRGLPD